MFSGGANALNNPATHEVAKKSFGTVMKSVLKGAADEIPQEVLDSGFNHIASEMNKGRTFQEATASYLESLPETLATAGLMGGAGHAAADQRNGNKTSSDQAPPPNSGSGKPLSTTVNNGQPPSTSPSDKQPPTTANNSKPPQTLAPPTTPPKSPEKSQQLIDNVSKMPAQAQQHPQVQADLAQAQQVVAEDAAKKAPQAPKAADSPPPTDTSSSSAKNEPSATTTADAKPAPAEPQATNTQQPAPAETAHNQKPDNTTRTDTTGIPESSGHPPPTTTNDSRRQPSSPTVPTLEEVSGARKTIDKLKAQERPLSPDQLVELDTAEKTVARKTEANILKQKAAIEASGGTLHPTTAKALADSQAILAKPGTDGTSRNSNNTNHTTSYHPEKTVANPTGTQQDTIGKTVNGTPPGQALETQKPTSSSLAQLKQSPPSSQPNPDAPSPGPLSSQTPASGAALPAQQLQDHIRATTKDLSGKFPGLEAHMTESAGPNGYSSGMWLNENGSIGYHVPTLAKQFIGMDAQTASNHIEALIDAHVQAASGQITQAPKPKSPYVGLQAQGIPGQTAPHALSTIKTALDAHTAHWKRLTKNLGALEAEIKTAVKQGDSSKKQMHERKRTQVKEEMEQLAEKTRQHVMVPEAARGKIVLTHVTPTTAAKAQAGADLVQMYTHASLLPTVGVVDFNRSRAAYLHGMVLINRLTSPSHVMHEIAHGIEEQNPRVLKACLDFLRKRAGNETPQLLATLTGKPKYGTERAYKDRFKELGGKDYMGRFYPGKDATEILTMGIERLHHNPVEFYVNDPEYFEFVIHTLQQP